jgi:two-component system cell cycle sensor histidine kinase/response regulator CckA
MQKSPGLTAQSHQKTVLVVEGDARILELVSEVMRDGNYKVLTASSGSLALEESRNYKGEIDLLLSDFQMTAMSGIDLATQMTIDRPALKVLLMSDFPHGMLVLNEGWHFLAKPFIPSQLRTLISGLVSPGKPSRFSK